MDSMPTNAPQVRLPARFLFRCAAPCYYAAKLAPGKVDLDDRYTLPDFASLEGLRSPAEVRVGWHETGLGISVVVKGKKRLPWCRTGRVLESDSFHLWVNTRPTGDVHRATRFCHHYAFMPAGAGRMGDQPLTAQLLINRAKEQAPIADGSHLAVTSKQLPDGYRMEMFVAASALAGYAPKDNPQLGFTYRVADTELGPQTWNVSNDFPLAEDPSVWGLLECKQ